MEQIFRVNTINIIQEKQTNLHAKKCLNRK